MPAPGQGAPPAEEWADIWDEALRSRNRIWTVCLAQAALLLVVSAGWCRSASRPLPQPAFVVVDDVGRATPVAYEALAWQDDPLHPSTKYFLRRFVTDHFSRRHATVAERWPRSLAYLERTLAQAASETLSGEVASFAASGRRERAVEGLALRVQARPEPPHEAVADYEVAVLENAREVARERWTTSMQFTFRDVAPHELTENPIGLVVTYYASDRADTAGGG